jgi:hypothetical protein
MPQPSPACPFTSAQCLDVYPYETLLEMVRAAGGQRIEVHPHERNNYRSFSCTSVMGFCCCFVGLCGIYIPEYEINSIVLPPLLQLSMNELLEFKPGWETKEWMVGEWGNRMLWYSRICLNRVMG